MHGEEFEGLKLSFLLPETRAQQEGDTCYLPVFACAGEDIAVESLDDHTLIGVQGPHAMAVLETVGGLDQLNLVKMPFMSSKAHLPRKTRGKDLEGK